MLELGVLGHRLVVSHPTPILEAWLRAGWEFPEQAPLALASPRTVNMELLEKAPAGFPTTLPASPLHLELGPLVGELPLRTEGEVYWLGDETAGVRLELRDNGAAINVWGASPLLLPAVQVALIETLRASGFVLFHAAAAVRAGDVTLFLGPSGTGKTTTLLRVLEAGWQAVAEDLAWLDPRDLRVYGWDRGLHVLPDTAQHLLAYRPDLKLGEAGTDGKFSVPYEALGNPRGHGQLRRIVALERMPEQSTAWTLLTPLKTGLALWRATGVPLSSRAQEALAVLVPRLVHEVESMRLVLGQGEIRFGEIERRP